MTGDSELDGRAYRRLLGHFCTGVTVVAGMTDGRPVGFACQAFAALSITPPLVLFCPAKTSRVWPLIENAGSFTVSVLAQDQQDVSARFGTPGADKFDGLPWFVAPSGAPAFEGALCWIDCHVSDIFDGGDHFIVTGRVNASGESPIEEPLLFFRGGYARTAPSEKSADVLTNLITWMQRYERDEVWM